MRKQNAIFIHGLNNKIEAFRELGQEFEDQYEIVYLKLPHHKDKTPLNFSFKEALEEFKKDLLAHLSEASFIISYSLGCSYLQYLWERGELFFPMEKIIYLSPALKTKMKLNTLGFLPGFFPVLSLAPKQFRLRPFCYWGQYKILYSLSNELKLESYPIIYADPKDELIDLTGLCYQKITREYLPYGKHHLTFHPSFYKMDQWEALIKSFKEYLKL